VKTSKVSNPFGTYLKQFQEHLECQFYRPVTIADYDRCLTALNSKMAELSVSLEELYEDTAVNRTRLEMRSVWRNLSRSTLAARSNVRLHRLRSLRQASRARGAESLRKHGACQNFGRFK
jgi:hypothetical protein